MKLLLDDKATRGYVLNANEACIFAAILKCTRAGRGWYGNYRELAAAMPFVINHSTVYRAIQKLLNLGLIERREEKLFALLQNETELLHNATELLQNETKLLQNVLPPNNPPINNNMNEKEKEQPRALRTHDGEKQQDCLFLEEDFNAFWIGFNPKPEFANRKNATWEIWKTKTPVARKKILEAVLSGTLPMGEGGGRGLNPYFYVQDFPEPEPTWLRGDEDLQIVQVRYNGAFKLCSLEDAQLFNLQIVRQWNHN